MKKILHIISQYPGKTGSGVYLNSLIREGYKLGYEQYLIAAKNSDDQLDKNEFIKEEYYLEFNCESMPFYVFGMSDIMPYKSTRYSDMTEVMFDKWKVKFEKLLQTAIKEVSPDLIISNHLWLATSLIKNHTDIPTLAICHGTDILQLKNNPRYKADVVQGCSKLDKVLALSEAQKDEIAQIYDIEEDRITVIGGGFNSEVFYHSESKSKDDTVRFVYAGKLSFSKGVKCLLNAYRRLQGKVELIIVGEGTGIEKEEIMSLSCRVDNKVTFKGQISQHELAEVFRSSDVFILPSFYEGLSLVTIEALACHLQIIVSELDNLKSFLGEEINESGVIDFIELPKFESLKDIREDELKLFEDRLYESMKLKVGRKEKSFEDSGFKDIEAKILCMSWNNIFKKIEELLKNMNI